MIGKVSIKFEARLSFFNLGKLKNFYGIYFILFYDKFSFSKFNMFGILFGNFDILFFLKSNFFKTGKFKKFYGIFYILLLSKYKAVKFCMSG